MRKAAVGAISFIALMSSAITNAQANPTVEVTPASATVGTLLNVTGTGFQPGTVSFHIDTVVVDGEVGAVDVGQNGTFVGEFVLPRVRTGRHQLVACRDISRTGVCREAAEGSFDVIVPPTTTARPPTTTLAPATTLAPTTTVRPTTTLATTTTVKPTTMPTTTLATTPVPPTLRPTTTSAPTITTSGSASTTTGPPANVPPVGVVTIAPTTTTGGLAVVPTATTSTTAPGLAIATTTTTGPQVLVGATAPIGPEPTYNPNPVDLAGVTTTLGPTEAVPTGSDTFDHELTHIEVTQGLQNLDNDFPLVEDRPTAVRVYGTSNTQSQTLVSAFLEVSRDGEVLGILESENMAALPHSLVRSSNAATPYFMLDPAWTTGTLTLRAIVFVLDPTLANDANPSDNLIQTSVTFHDADAATVHMYPLYLTDDATSGGGAPDIHTADDGWLLQGLAMYRLWPIGQITFDPFNPVLGDADSGWDLTEDGSLSDPFPALEMVHAANGYGPRDFVMGMVSPNVPSEFGGGGQRPGVASWSKMYDGWGAQWPWHQRSGAIIAQELGHNAGLAHAPCAYTAGDPLPGELHGGALDPTYPQSYSWPNCSIAPSDIEGYYGFDVLYNITPTSEPSIISNNPAASPPGKGTPFMGYAGTGKWTDPWHGCALLTYLGVPCTQTNLIPIDDDTPGQGQGVPQTGSAIPAFDCADLGDEDSDLCNLAPTVPFDPIALEDADADVMVLISIDPDEAVAALTAGPVLEPLLTDALRRPPGDDDAATSSSGITLKRGYISNEDLFAWSLLDYDGVDHLLLMYDGAGDLIGAKTVDVYNGSGSGSGDDHDHQNPLVDPDQPHVHGTARLTVRLPLLDGLASIDLVAAGQVLASLVPGDSPPVVEDFDATIDGDEAMLQWVASDPDGDPTTTLLQYRTDGEWDTIATPRHDTARVNLAMLPGGRDGTFRLLVSDGIRQSSALSESISLPDRQPFATIILPGDGSSRASGRPVTFRGSAIDLEDGDQSTIRWQSDLDGSFGEGATVSLRDLSEGIHHITMTATDASGNVAEASIEVVITPSDLSPPELRAAVGEIFRNGIPDRRDGSSAWLIAGLIAALAAAVGLVSVMVRTRRSEPQPLDA